MSTRKTNSGRTRIEQCDQTSAQANEELLRGDRSAETVLGAVREDEIDVGRQVEFPRTELAHGENDQLLRFPVDRRRRAPLLFGERLQAGETGLDDHVGEIGQAAQCPELSGARQIAQQNPDHAAIADVAKDAAEAVRRRVAAVDVAEIVGEVRCECVARRSPLVFAIVEQARRLIDSDTARRRPSHCRAPAPRRPRWRARRPRPLAKPLHGRGDHSFPCVRQRGSGHLRRPASSVGADRDAADPADDSSRSAKVASASSRMPERLVVRPPFSSGSTTRRLLSDCATVSACRRSAARADS